VIASAGFPAAGVRSVRSIVRYPHPHAFQIAQPAVACSKHHRARTRRFHSGPLQHLCGKAVVHPVSSSATVRRFACRRSASAEASVRSAAPPQACRPVTPPSGSKARMCILYFQFLRSSQAKIPSVRRVRARAPPQDQLTCGSSSTAELYVSQR